MRSNRLPKSLLIVAMSMGWLFGNVSCVPNRAQFNGAINNSILNGLSLALTLGISSLVGGIVPGTTTTTGT